MTCQRTTFMVVFNTVDCKNVSPAHLTFWIYRHAYTINRTQKKKKKTFRNETRVNNWCNIGLKIFFSCVCLFIFCLKIQNNLAIMRKTENKKELLSHICKIKWPKRRVLRYCYVLLDQKNQTAASSVLWMIILLQQIIIFKLNFKSCTRWVLYFVWNFASRFNIHATLKTLSDIVKHRNYLHCWKTSSIVCFFFFFLFDRFLNEVGRKVEESKFYVESLTIWAVSSLYLARR